MPSTTFSVPTSLHSRCFRGVVTDSRRRSAKIFHMLHCAIAELFYQLSYIAYFVAFFIMMSNVDE